MSKKQQKKKFSIPKPTYKLALRIVPAQNAASGVGMGVEGARYHLGHLCEDLKSEGMATGWTDNSVDQATRARLQREINHFHWHLRAFFWELVAEFDTLLVAVNDAEGLGIPEEKICWKEVARQALGQKKWSTRIDTLKNSYCSAWYTEIRTYRNFAHRLPLFVHSDYGPGGLNAIALLSAIEGQQQRDLRDQLPEYLSRMEQLAGNLSPRKLGC